MEIRKAVSQDYNDLAALTEQEGWNYSEQDFKDMDATGCAMTFVAVDGARILGMITLMDYGDVGWISNMLVAKPLRGKRLGGELLGAGMKALEGKASITLFSYMDAKRFYLRHGFRCDRDFSLVRFMGGKEGSFREEGRPEEAFALDERVIGWKRQGLLKVLASRGRILFPAGGGKGYAIVRPDPREPVVGPVVTERMEDGRELLYGAFNALGKGALATVPDGRIDGVEEVFTVSRLYMGEKPHTDFSRIFAFAGLEFG